METGEPSSDTIIQKIVERVFLGLVFYDRRASQTTSFTFDGIGQISYNKPFKHRLNKQWNSERVLKRLGEWINCF